MKIICNSCKAIIDTEKHDFCPKCGANFVYGERLKTDASSAVRDEAMAQSEELNRRQVEQQIENNERISQHEAEKRNSPPPMKSETDRNAQWEEHRRYHQKNTAKKADKKATGEKNGCIGCFVVALFFVIGMGNILKDVDEDMDFSDIMENIEDAVEDFVNEEAAGTTAYGWDGEIPAVYTSIPSYIVGEFGLGNITSTTEEIDDTPNTALTGEIAYTDTYSITLKEIKLYENEAFAAPEGYVYMSFSLSLQNISDYDRFYYDILTLEADGVECAAATFAGLFIPGDLAPDEIYEETVVYQVPVDAIFLDLHYGNDVTLYGLSYDVEGFEPDFGYEYDGDGSQY